jgi:hypothetical protein
MRRNRTAILLFARLPRWSSKKTGNFKLMTILPQTKPLQPTLTLLLAFAFLLVFAPPALSAQEIPVHMELFGGYSYMRFDSSVLGFAHDSNLNGGNLSLSVPHLFHSHKYHLLGVVADVSANYGSHLSVYNFLIGPQITVDKRGYTFFVHGLWGKSRERYGIQEQFVPGFSSLGRALAFGGGVQKQWHSNLAVRIVQADFISNNNGFGVDTGFGVTQNTQNNLRISTGLVFQFGGK